MEKNYIGPQISYEQHVEHVKMAVFEEWIQIWTKCEEPHLPLMVDVELFEQACDSVRDKVMEYHLRGLSYFDPK